jgi:hypothetical protein
MDNMHLTAQNLASRIGKVVVSWRVEGFFQEMAFILFDYEPSKATLRFIGNYSTMS